MAPHGSTPPLLLHKLVKLPLHTIVMTAFSLAALAWVRAQGIYILLHIAGIILSLFASAFLPGGGGEGPVDFLLFISMFSCGFALVFGIPAALVLMVVMHFVAPMAARARMLMPVVLTLSLAATVGALATGFRAVGDELGRMDGLVLFFSALALVSMAASVFSLRRRIRALQSWLRGEEEDFYTASSESPTEQPTTLLH